MKQAILQVGVWSAAPQPEVDWNREKMDWIPNLMDQTQFVLATLLF